MKKLLMYLIKYVNHYTYSTLPPEKEAESFVNMIFYKTELIHAMEVNDEIQKQIKQKLLEVKEEYSGVISKINELYPSEPLKVIHQLHEIQQ